MFDIRDALVEELVKDLVGPRDVHEVLSDTPIGWYIAGILFPRGTEFEPDDEELLQAGEEEEGSESTENVPINTSFKQNSIGLSCNIKPNTTEILIEVEYAYYEIVDEKETHKKWKRVPIKSTHTIMLDHTGDSFNVGRGEAKIIWSFQEGRGFRILTVFLYNNLSLPKHDDKEDASKPKSYISRFHEISKRSLFQPQIMIKSVDPSQAIFNNAEIQLNDDIYAEDDIDSSLSLLYRDKHVYGKGYNCAADWDRSSDPSSIRTEIIPVHNSRSIKWSRSDENEKNRPMDVDMKLIVETNGPTEIRKILSPLVDLYESWIENLSKGLSFVSGKNGEKKSLQMQKTTDEHIRKCKTALRRMRDGIQIIEERQDVYEAFVFANKAMLYQRSHYQFAISKFRGDKNLGSRPEPNKTGKYMWRPFQIAFILMNIKGIADPSSGEREIADLLWFPTGGGKTEAYLGLSAFTIALRRINGRSTSSKGNGVSVIMRYTLRLLTIQQFQRATALICACEKIRRDNPSRWGEEPFLIGLWVGHQSTPNNFQIARKSLMDLKIGKKPLESDPVQFSFCPWCGSDIDYKNFSPDDTRQWIVARCLNRGCDFYTNQPNDISRALPVLTVDEDIYKRCPSMIVATVDKFARMPWNSQAAAIFGNVNKYCARHGFLTAGDKNCTASVHKNKDGTKITVYPIDPLLPPDLIIQDELHLISGPLGTMVGIYETAIEYMSSQVRGKEVFRPKIILSTATVKGAQYQVQKLFNRKGTETFPPSGINSDDAFFWWEVKQGGRKFIGVSIPSYSMKTAILRIYASLLQKVLELKVSGADNIDPYWTLVGYFNSIRELGGVLRLLEDDVVRRINDIVDLIDEHRGFQKRIIEHKEELTGRVPSIRIPKILSALENNVGSGESIDVLLATNMISVGVDVDRLGLMVVTGQPKNSAEYIQAVGRVGRKNESPGLILTLYNPYRPRDLSHYENFKGYHSMLQRYVDPVSLTPFSERALDRALHAVFISMIRMKLKEFSSREDAYLFSHLNPQIRLIVSALQQRFKEVENCDDENDNFINFTNEVNKIIDWWNNMKVESNGKLAYSKKNAWKDLEPTEIVLMKDIGEDNTLARVTPGSMRDVEKESNLHYYWAS